MIKNPNDENKKYQQVVSLDEEIHEDIMGDHLLAPDKGIPAVMPHSGKQGGIGQLKIFQETI